MLHMDLSRIAILPAKVLETIVGTQLKCNRGEARAYLLSMYLVGLGLTGAQDELRTVNLHTRHVLLQI